MDIISVAISDDFRFNDKRRVSYETALTIKKALKKTKVALEIDISLINSSMIDGFDYIQPIGHHIPELNERILLKEKGIHFIYSYLQICPDDDPSWIFSRFENKDDLNVSYFQVDVYNEFQNAWDILKNQKSEYSEEFQLEDLKKIIKDYPTFCIFNYSPDNITEIVSMLPDMAGITMVLADLCNRDDIHYFTWENMISVLKSLNSHRT